jgi:hypothetical protein
MEPDEVILEQVRRQHLEELGDFYKDMETKLPTCSVVYAEDSFKSEEFFRFMWTFAMTCRGSLK